MLVLILTIMDILMITAGMLSSPCTDVCVLLYLHLSANVETLCVDVGVCSLCIILFKHTMLSLLFLLYLSTFLKYANIFLVFFGRTFLSYLVTCRTSCHLRIMLFCKCEEAFVDIKDADFCLGVG